MMTFNDDLIKRMSVAEEVFWQNTDKKPIEGFPVSAGDVEKASKRLERFSPVISALFPETVPFGGIIESPLDNIYKTATKLGAEVPLYIKRDDSLPIAGSVKARGGIYEVLKHAEDIALKEGILSTAGDEHIKLVSLAAKELFSKYKIQVGSTGNLGMSIGIMSAALGFETVVHMSADAKQWKKDKLREKGAVVKEYEGDYGQAVKRGRELSEKDEFSYFVDDEKSKDLFCGYAVAGGRLKKQLDEIGIVVDEKSPLYVYIPCGVGGAPGGIGFGLKLVFGESVHVFFAEPTEAPCMLLGIKTGLFEKISVRDIGLTGRTVADGLAVGRCSSLASPAAAAIIDGEATVADEKLPYYQKTLWENDRIYIEPSSCAAFEPFIRFNQTPHRGTHIIWSTGGSMVPENIRRAELGI